MKKGDRTSRYGGTNRQRAAGLGWLNWHSNHGRIPRDLPQREFRQALRRVSWRRVL